MPRFTHTSTQTWAGLDRLQWTASDRLRDWSAFTSFNIPPQPHTFPNYQKFQEFIIAESPHPSTAPCGFIAITRQYRLQALQPEIVVLSMIEIHPRFRQQGLASRLLHQLASLCHQNQWHILRTPPLPSAPPQFTSAVTAFLLHQQIPSSYSHPLWPTEPPLS